MRINKFAGDTSKWLRANWLAMLAAPVLETPGLMLMFMAMQVVIPCCYYFGLKPQLTDYAPWYNFGIMLSEAAVMAWCMLMAYTLLKHWTRIASGIWCGLCMTALAMNAMIDYALLKIYEASFSNDIAAVIAATNIGEGGDFISSYFNADFLLTLLAIVAGYVAAYLLGALILKKQVFDRLVARGHKTALLLRLVAVALITGAWTNVLVVPRMLVNKTNMRHKFMSFVSLDIGHEIVPQHPALKVDNTDAPTDIVLIIGESHGSAHSQLNGYDKANQPRLAALQADSLLYVYGKAVSPAQHTMQSLTRMIGTWRGEDDLNWYDCTTLLEVANLSGYQTYWLSNQSAKGIYDNPVMKIAEFCNTYEYTNNGMYGASSGGFDQRVLPLVDKYAKSGGRKLTIVHLMGSHVTYWARFPSMYTVFKASDYDHRPENQRQIVADYDNSILYNDYIVSEIINRYVDRDAVVIYLSDHAQDVFVSDPKYFGHSKADNPVSVAAGSDIPFYVYMSSQFKEQHPAMASRIAGGVGRNINTSDLIYTLMDLMGSRFANNDDVATRSFFRE